MSRKRGPNNTHVVLAGDSIFDNDAYVPGEPGVLRQLKATLPEGWSASKVAVDGDCIDDVGRQLRNVPFGRNHIVVSVGGNDVYAHIDLLTEVRSIADLAEAVKGPLEGFRADYRAMLDLVTGGDADVTVCTIYTAIPFPDERLRTLTPHAIGHFNAIILEEAAARGVPVLRLDELLTDAADYSAASPIEPSVQGGAKIAHAIAAHVVGRVERSTALPA